MTAQMIINQAGLPAGVAGEARDDGLDTGAVVTLQSTAHVNTFRFRLLWVPQHPTPDVSAVATLTQSGPTTYSFTPSAARYGSYLIELITDEATIREDRQTRVFAIKNGLRIPAGNEFSDPTASLATVTPAQFASYVDRTPFNQPDGIVGSPFELGTWITWWATLADLIHSFNAGGGGGGGGQAITVVASQSLPTAGYFVVDTSGGAVNLTLPDPATALGERVIKLAVGGNPLTLVRFGAESIEGVAANAALVGVGNSWRVVSDGTDWWFV